MTKSKRKTHWADRLKANKEITLPFTFVIVLTEQIDLKQRKKSFYFLSLRLCSLNRLAQSKQNKTVYLHTIRLEQINTKPFSFFPTLMLIGRGQHKAVDNHADRKRTTQSGRQPRWLKEDNTKLETTTLVGKEHKAGDNHTDWKRTTQSWRQPFLPLWLGAAHRVWTFSAGAAVSHPSGVQWLAWWRFSCGFGRSLSTNNVTHTIMNSSNKRRSRAKAQSNCVQNREIKKNQKIYSFVTMPFSWSSVPL